MFGRIFLFFSLFFSLFSGVFADDYQVVSGISTTSLVGKNFSLENWNLTKTWSNFFLYNNNYYKYIFFLSGSSQYSWEWNIFDGHFTNKYSYYSDSAIITIITAIHSGYPPFNSGWETFFWFRQKRDSNSQDPSQIEWSIKSKTCFDLFDWWPAYSACSMYSFPLRFHSWSVTEYGVGIASIDFVWNKSQRIYYVPDIWSPSYISWQDPIMIESPVSSLDYNTFLPKKSWSYHHYSWYYPTYDSDFFIVSSKWDWKKSYNLSSSWVEKIEWSDDDQISRLTFSEISSGIPSWFSDTTYCRTSAGYDIISYFDRNTWSGQSYKFYPDTWTTTATTDGKICITDLYPDPRGAYVDISDVFGKIAWNGWPLAIIASDSGGYYYATGSQIRYTDTALTGWDSFPSWGGGGWSLDTGYSPSANGYDCKPVYFSSWSSDGVHIDIPTDEYIYSTGVTSWPPPNSSYSAHLFENWDRSKKVVSVIKPFPTSLINIYSWSILGSQSWSYVNFTSSTEFATLKGTNIPVSGLEFSAVENGDFLNIVRVVFNTTTDGWTFPIQWSDIIGYAVFFNTATWQYETQNIKKTSSWTWEVRSEKWWQIVQIVWVPGFSFSHVDLFYWSKYTIKKYECMNNAWECYWSRSATWSFSCGWKINPIYWNEIGSCESVGEYCQPSTNTSTGKLDPFNYLDASGSIRPVYNQSGSISWIAYNSQADDIFSCSYSWLETLLCVPEILWKIWKRFTVALKNLLDFLYSISSISSPKWDWKILWFVNVASAYDAGATLRLPYYTTSTGAKITKETFTWSKNPMSINSSMATMWDNVNNLPDGWIKGIFAFAIYSTILIVLFIVTVMIAVAFSNK